LWAISKNLSYYEVNTLRSEYPATATILSLPKFESVSVLQLPLCVDHQDSEDPRSPDNYPDAYSFLNVSASLLMASFASATFFNAIKY
jgi:hypothetical protein